MWPSLNLLYPDIAASMLQYRLDRLPGARFKTTTYNPPYAGAMFPWESATSGTELAAAPWGQVSSRRAATSTWLLDGR